MEKTIYVWESAIFRSLLRRYREEAGLSQQTVASRLQETQTFVSKCERGERRIDLVELLWWCEALDVELSTFVQRYQEERQSALKLNENTP